MDIRIPSVARDNKGHVYDASVFLSESPFDIGTEIVRINGTPGTWYLRDVLTAGDRVALDYGAGWFIVNFRQVIALLLGAMAEAAT